MTASPVTVCVGDIHGHLQRLLNLWHNLELHLGPHAFTSCTVIFLGDYNDRGPHTAGVLDFLISLPRRYPAQKHVFLCGNHDFAFGAFVGALPPAPADFSFAHTWKEFEKSREREGWWTGPGQEDIHVQGVRWGGTMTVPFNKIKGTPYQGSTYDSKPTFESYGVAHGDRQGLLRAVPESHKKFLRDLVWVHEQDGVQTGDPNTNYSTLIAVHAGLEASKPIEEQLQLLRRRDVTHPRVEPLSGRKNVWDTPSELGDRGVLLVSGHHGAMLQLQHRLIIDESGGLDHLPLAAIVLPSRAVVRDTDEIGGAHPISNIKLCCLPLGLTYMCNNATSHSSVNTTRPLEVNLTRSTKHGTRTATRPPNNTGIGCVYDEC